jgi:hypothetical protein
MIFSSAIQMASSYSFRLYLGMIHWHFQSTVATISQKKLRGHLKLLCIKNKALYNDESLYT